MIAELATMPVSDVINHFQAGTARLERGPDGKAMLKIVKGEAA